jgi:hypothetical protein
VHLAWDPKNLCLFDAETDERVEPPPPGRKEG